MEANWDDLLKYVITLGAVLGLAFKVVDAWEKRRSVPIKKLEDRMEKAEENVKSIEDDIKELNTKQNDQKHTTDRLYEHLLNWFKK